MIDWLLDLFQDRTFGAARSPKWSQVRAQHLALYPKCAVCGTKGSFLKPNEAHHCTPFHKKPALELEPKNLITLCRRDHLLFGHLCNFKSYNKSIRKDAASFYKKITNRP